MTTQRAPDTVRDIDPNVLQRRASNPEHSVWVSASAGSGKTKVLTDRILRLMLPRDDGTPGSRPEKILAITFTKAGANEMSLRLTERLSQWVTLSPDALADDLKDLLGRPPTKEDMIAARRLFARVTETPGGLKIMTIHSFCQSVLSRFPLEARVNPQFELLDDTQQKKLLTQARETVMAQALKEVTSPLSESLRRIASLLDENSFLKCLNDVMAEPRQMNHLKSRYFGIDGIYASLCQSMDIQPGLKEETIILDACSDDTFDQTGLRLAVAALSQGTPSTDIPKGMSIQTWIDAAPSDRSLLLPAYKKAFLTKDDDIQSRLTTKKPQKIYPDILNVMTREAQRLMDVQEKIRAAESCLLTADILRLGDAVQTAYQDLKRQYSFLDFNDLILTTLDLLTGKTLDTDAEDIVPWVMYKLDQGIEHILVDEAQDTNPEQWEIIQTLSLEFFEGLSAQDKNRTVFVVGDEKQSIFGFQRAAPEKMAAMKKWFTKKISDAGKTLDIIPMNVSFRSAPVILNAVDAVMAQDSVRQGLGTEVLPHIPYRRGQAGEVELWPIWKPDEDEDEDFLSPPVHVTARQSGAEKMAGHVARQIKNWVGQKPLPSRGRTVQPGDILILMRTRSAFVEKLVRALKRQGIPVSGVDRMVLPDQLIVQDLLTLAQTALLPEDDLSLACVLTSPFVGWDDNALFTLAHGRGKMTVWENLRQTTKHSEIVSWIEDLQQKAAAMPPYEFFLHVLNAPCPADAQSGLRALSGRLGADMRDPLDEFLNAALDFERSNEPSLPLFIHAQSQSEQDIKRELEKAGGAVRIMTIHGAKGLQAPIVIMPDTIRSNGGTPMDRLLWPSKTGLDLPLFIPSKKNAPVPARMASSRYEEKMMAESARLLYVAMTRAEDCLYIGGYQGKKEPAPESWYFSIRRGLESMPDILREPCDFDETDVILRLSESQQKSPDRIKKQKIEIEENIKEIPEWIFDPAPREPLPPKSLMPSRPSLPDVLATSPIAGQDVDRFMRGNITHKLLQILPDLSPEIRESVARAYTMRPQNGLSQDTAQNIVAEVMAILNNPDYAALFGGESLAEVPVTGFIAPDILVSGQIDRIVIKPDEISILDYKTNQPAPSDPMAVPASYRQQLKTYGCVMAEIYPGHRIRTYLLWTETAQIMELPFSAP
jgi:ATP-dependent helicase/nuclease subunit A